MDIVKYYTYIEPANFQRTSVVKNKYQTASRRWVEWVTTISLYTCAYCLDRHGHIFARNDSTVRWPPVHENCHCQIRSYPPSRLVLRLRMGWMVSITTYLPITVYQTIT